MSADGRKRLSAIGLLAIPLLGLAAGCEPRSDRLPGGMPNESLVVLVDGGSPWWRWASVVSAARAAQRRYTFLRVEALPAPAGDSNAETLIAAALARHPRAIAFVSEAPPPEARFAEMRQRIAREGVVLITADTLPQDGAGGAHVCIDLTSGAELLAEQLETLAAGGRSCLLFHEGSASADPPRRAVRDRFLDRVRSHEAVKVLNDWEEPNTAAAAVTAAGAVLDDYRNASLVVSLHPALRPETLGAGRAARLWALLGATPAQWPRVDAGGVVALAGVLDGKIGTGIAELVAQQLTNGGQEPGVRVISCELVTRATLDDFAIRYATAADTTVEALWPGHVATPRTTSTSAPAGATRP